MGREALARRDEPESDVEGPEEIPLKAEDIEYFPESYQTFSEGIDASMKAKIRAQRRLTEEYENDLTAALAGRDAKVEEIISKYRALVEELEGSDPELYKSKEQEISVMLDNDLTEAETALETRKENLSAEFNQEWTALAQMYLDRREALVRKYVEASDEKKD
jgi:hypothetical protein